jgi:hypothetical protein
MSTLHDTFPGGPSAQAPLVLASLLSPPLVLNKSSTLSRRVFRLPSILCLLLIPRSQLLWPPTLATAPTDPPRFRGTHPRHTHTLRPQPRSLGLAPDPLTSSPDPRKARSALRFVVHHAFPCVTGRL